MLQGLDTRAALVYAPVQEELVKVEESLHRLAKVDVPQLVQLLSYIMDTKGKRVRPAITLLASKFRECNPDLPILMATAVELLHIATLIHDDTVDNSPLRRGKATVSNRWGQKVAILLGDYVFATSATFVCDTKHVRVIRRFSETIMELSSGELLEYFHALNWRLSRADYEDRIYRKTASLFRTAAESGALLSGVSEEVAQALADYGCNIGLAFQIIDDVLDVQGNASEIGKPVGNDLLQGVVTLPHIMLVERYPNDNPIQRLFDGDRDPASLRRVIEMIQSSDIVEQCYTTARNYCEKALAALKYVPEAPPKQSLEALASYTMERKR